MSDTATQTTSPISRSFLQGLPKAELHVHIEGTLEPELKLALAQKHGIKLKQDTVEEIKATYNFNDLPSFLDVYYEGMNVLLDEDDFYQLAWEYLLKARKDNVRHIEIFFDPQAHTSRGVSYQTVVRGLTRACKDARALGIDAKLIQCFLRDFSRASAQQHLDALLDPADELASLLAEHVIGVGLDSDEHNNPPLKFYYQYALAQQKGLHTTAHADIDQLDSIGHIKELLEVLNIERIDHGTNVVENADLLALAAKRHVGFTSCPISNSFINNDYKEREVRQLLDAGVYVCINSDDPAYFGGYITDNYKTLASTGLFSQSDMVEIAKNSFRASWISDEAKAVYLAEIDAYVGNQQ